MTIEPKSLPVDSPTDVPKGLRRRSPNRCHPCQPSSSQRYSTRAVNHLRWIWGTQTRPASLHPPEPWEVVEVDHSNNGHCGLLSPTTGLSVRESTDPFRIRSSHAPWLGSDRSRSLPSCLVRAACRLSRGVDRFVVISTATVSARKDGPILAVFSSPPHPPADQGAQATGSGDSVPLTLLQDLPA